MGVNICLPALVTILCGIFKTLSPKVGLHMLNLVANFVVYFGVVLHLTWPYALIDLDTIKSVFTMATTPPCDH